MSDHRIRIETFGCRANKYDSAVLRGELVASGFSLAERDEPFDILIVNSCTVTNSADQETRRFLNSARKRYPGAQLVLTGCQSRLPETQAEQRPIVDLLAPNHPEQPLVDQLNAHLKRDMGPRSPAIPLPDLSRETRFFFKIQDGCDVRCAFCVIPDARGSARSLPVETVLQTVKQATDRGFREIILSGIHLGYYGRDLEGAQSLDRLLTTLLDHTPVERIRLGSIEPWGVRPALIKRLATDPRLLPSLHLPLQSGSETILKAMRRPISARRYQQLVEQLMEHIPNLTLWIDLIVGFPGETTALFEDTVAYLEQLPFTRLHVFPYSIRSGTPAATYLHQVSAQEKQERVERLLVLSDQRYVQQLDRRVGSEDEVLVERNGTGHTRDNLPVKFLEMPVERGSIQRVWVAGHDGQRLQVSTRPLERFGV